MCWEVRLLGGEFVNSVDVLSGPAWNNSDEYSSIDSSDFNDDLTLVRKKSEVLKSQSVIIEECLKRVAQLDSCNLVLIEAAARQRRLADEIFIVGANLGTYVSCQLSVNGGHVQARQMQAVVRQLMTDLEEHSVSLNQLMIEAPAEFVSACLSREEFRPHEFLIHKQRDFRPFKLSLEQEKLLTRFAVNGLHGWSTLYDNISTSLRCLVKIGNDEKTLGLARAAGYAQSPNVEERREVYRAVKSAWQTQQESCASILNALAGWRLDENELRSQRSPVHFLDQSLHKCRIESVTLETMISVVEESLPLARRALELKAKALEVERIGPWDLFAPLPEHMSDGVRDVIPFSDAIELVRTAFAQISPEMGEFVTLMHKNEWIEGQVTDTKRPGAYCTRFAKSRNPRVYMTYKGSLDDVGTLAHELGHAFHNWVMRDLPLPETWYPMTLAETASILAETAVSDVMLKNAATVAAKRKVLWGDLGSAEAFLMNIPARFWFECELYKARRERTLSPSELSDLMSAAWKRAYGDSLSEMNEFFWCSKLHFHMSSTSFYNYPYTFGYLFALGVYAQREKMGPDFYGAYVNLLRDTGRMTAEELALKHLNADIRKPQFWMDSIAIIRKQIDYYVSLS